MKFILIALFLFTPYLQYAQSDPSMDKFIRIVGLAEKELKSDGMELNFTLSEIEGNEYKQIRHKSLVNVKDEFINLVKAEGVDASRLVEDKMKNIIKSRYDKIAVSHYKMEVKNEDEAIKIAQISADGFKVSEVNYIFKDNYEDYLLDMSTEAIKDARRKADKIASSVGKTVGNILNIEDLKNANTRGNSRYETKSAVKKLSYRVNVTFELN